MPTAASLFGPSQGGLFDPPAEPRRQRASDLIAASNPQVADATVGTEALLPKNQGAFMSGLQWLGRFGQVGKNLAGAALGTSGSVEGAARQGADILGEAVDAFLPGDLIGQASRPQDDVTGADVLGISKEWQKANPLLSIGASLPIDLALDPITWVPGANIAKAVGTVGKSAAQAIGKIPGGTEALAAGGKAVAKTGEALRSIAGVQRLTPQARSILDASKAARSVESQAGISAIGASSLKNVSPDEANILGDVFDNVARDAAGKPVGDLYPRSLDPIKGLESHPGVTPDNLDRLRSAAYDIMGIGQNQAKREGIFYKTKTPDPLLFGAETATQSGMNTAYLPRSYKGQTADQMVDEVLGSGPGKMGAPGATKERSLEAGEEIASFLKAEPGVELERNAIDRLAKRASAQGELAARAEIGKGLIGPEFTYADSAQRTAANNRIREMAASADPVERESAKVIYDAFNGLKPRGPVTDVLAKVNRVVKPMMVYGFAIPKFGAIVRNKISGIWQAASDPAGRAVAADQAKRFPTDLYGAVVDSLGINVPKDKLGSAMGLVEDAFKTSDGLAENAAQTLARSPGAGGYTGEELAGMVRSGALAGFVSSEDLIRSMASSPKAKTWKSVTEWPARMFKGVEDRMRGGMYLDLIRKGKSPEEAARVVSDSMYDYSISSAGNRAVRDFLPFSNYVMKAGVQQGKLLAEKPWLAVALSSLLTEKEGQAKYPYMDGKLALPLGDDEKGNAQYLTGLGLPFESLNMIPNPSGSLQEFGRDLGRTFVGSSQPLLKTAGSLAFGNDPTFGTPVGSYSKLPGNVEAGSFGRAYNTLAGAGLTQPVESALRTIGKIADDRTTAGTKALDLLTGASITNVDPDRALQQRLTAYLRANPEVASIQSLYSKSDDPEVKALLKQLNEAKAKVKQKREAAK